VGKALDAGMNRVNIIAVGNEILTGRVVDTNSNWLAKAITALGGEVARCVTVRDVVDEIAQEVRTAVASTARIVITTGGLGPTSDDRTLEGVARAADQPLVLHAEALEWVIQKYEEFKKKGYVDSDDITPGREKMAHLPDSSTPLPNSLGAAPGVMLKGMFTEHVEERLRTIFGPRAVVEQNVTTDVGDESTLVPIIDAVMKGVDGVYLKSKPTHFGRDVRIGICITASADAEDEARAEVKRAVAELEGRLRTIGQSIVDYADLKTLSLQCRVHGRGPVYRARSLNYREVPHKEAVISLISVDSSVCSLKSANGSGPTRVQGEYSTRPTEGRSHIRWRITGGDLNTCERRPGWCDLRQQAPEGIRQSAYDTNRITGELGNQPRRR